MKENKHLAVNLAANIVAFVVQFGVNFLLTPYIVECLGSAAYGFVPIASNMIACVNIVTVALNSMASRFLTLETVRGDIDRARTYFSSIFISNAILTLALAIPSILVVDHIDAIMDVPDDMLADVRLTFAYALLGMEVNLLFNVYGNVYYVTNRMELSARRNIQGNILRAAVLVLLFAVFKPHIWYVTATTLIVTVFLCVTNIRQTHRLTPLMRIDPRGFSWDAVRTLLASGVWNSVNQLSTVLLVTLDVIMANALFGAVAGGEYSIVKTVPNFIQSFVGVLSGVFVPQFMAHYARRQWSSLLTSIDYAVKVMAYMLMIPVGFLLSFGEDFFRLWVPGEDAALLQGLSVLTLLPLLITCSINPVYNVYTVANRLKVPALVWLGFGIMNVALVVVVARCTGLGIWTIPVVSLVLGVARNITFTPVYAARCLGVPWHTFYASIARGVACAVVMYLVCSLYRALPIPVDSWGTLLLAGCVCSLAAGAVNLFVVFERDERRRLVCLLPGNRSSHKEETP